MKRPKTPSSTDPRLKNRQDMAPLINMIQSLLGSADSEPPSIQCAPLDYAGTAQLRRNGITKEVRKSQPTSHDYPRYVYKAYKDRAGEMKQSGQSEVLASMNSLECRSARPKTSGRASHQLRRELSSTQNSSYSTCKDRSVSLASSRNEMLRRQSIKMQFKLLQTEAPIVKPPKPPKSIPSSKNIGLMRGYGVNSYRLPLSTHISQGRVLIIANVTKTSNLQLLTSLYAVFQTCKSAAFIDFLREQFQSEISKRLSTTPMPSINKQLVESCMHRVEMKYCHTINAVVKRSGYQTAGLLNSFGMSYGLVFVTGEQVVICTKGTTQVRLSLNYGSKMNNYGSNVLSIWTLDRQQIEQIDFIAILSEGIHRNKMFRNELDSQQQELKPMPPTMQCKIWQALLSFINNSDTNESSLQQQARSRSSIHSLMGSCVDKIYEELYSCPSDRNMSMVLLGFRNVEKLLQAELLELPWCALKPGKTQQDRIQYQHQWLRP